MTENERREMSDMIQTAINVAVPIAIKETVNGKIDRLSKKVDDHMVDMKPYMQGITGVKFVYRTILTLGALGAAWVGIKSAIGEHIQIFF